LLLDEEEEDEVTQGGMLGKFCTTGRTFNNMWNFCKFKSQFLGMLKIPVMWIMIFVSGVSF
jgi:hypothetical protein